MAELVRIKPEPEAGSPFAEDELDESTDLEFYDKNFQEDTYSRMYLARLPASLWKAWAELDDDEEIEIGKIRQWAMPNGKLKVQMLLRSDLEPHRMLPKEYNMDITSLDVRNTFIFSEQDLPSYAAKNKERAAALAQGIPAHLLRQQQTTGKETQPSDRAGRRPGPYTRRAIPKKTTIAGKVKHEVQCTPVENAETNHLLALRAVELQAPKAKIKIEGKLPPTAPMNQADEWKGFVKTTDTKLSKAKKMENKTARWPENQVIDALVEAFSQYRYWSIKTLRSRIPQPDGYLRTCVEKIAKLHKSGPFANHWQLRDEYQGMITEKGFSQPANDAALPTADGDLDSDEDDDDINMEDVVV